MCLSGALTYEQYIQRNVDAGFGQVETGASPLSSLDRHTYNLEDHLLLKVLILSLQSSHSRGCPCIFTGKTGIYSGAEEVLMTQLDTFSSAVTRQLCVIRRRRSWQR